MSTRKRKLENLKIYCRCKIHETAMGTSPGVKYVLYNTKTRNDFKRSSLKYLIANNHISEKSSNVCSFCLHYAETKQKENSEETIEDYTSACSIAENEDIINSDVICNAFENLCMLLENYNEHNDDNVNLHVIKLVNLIGKKFVMKNLKTTDLKELYKDTRNLNSKQFLEKTNPILKSFLSSAIGVDLDRTTCSQYMFKFAVVIEGIYHLLNQNTILPHCFMLNLIETFISGSKTVTALNGIVLPSASDTTYRNWLKEQGKNKLETPQGDIYVFVDNIGKYIVKNYRIKSDQNNKANVVTATVNIPLKSDSFIQSKDDLKPGNWASGKSENDIQTQMEKAITDGEEKFREYRYHYIVSIFEYLANSHDMDKAISESIGILNSSELKRVCSNSDCLTKYLARKLKCDECGSQVVQGDRSHHLSSTPVKKLPKYFNVGEKNTINKTTLTMGEPVMVNPNSYQNMETILTTLKSNVIDNNQRKWVFVGADGPPYTLMRRIIHSNPDRYV